MKKIITAINNPSLNEKLKLEKNIEIVCKDIQYKEAILEILSKNKNIDIIIINNNLPGEIETENLIKKIKLINEKIKLIFILEKENKKIEEKLKELNINNIYYNSKINIEKLIKIINEENENSEEEIKKELNELKKMILENNLKKENNKYKKIKKNFNVEKNIKNKLLKKEKINHKNKIITISGPANVGKTLTIINIAKILENKSNKILIIDFDINKSNIHTFLGIKRYQKKINNIIKLNNSNIENILENLIIKYNKKINIISGLKLFFENNEINNIDKINLFIFDFFNNLKKLYDFILIDVGSENIKYLNNKIIENADLNFLLIEGNLAGINKAKIFLNKLNCKNNFRIIINKKDRYCIDFKILENLFENKNKIEIIRYNKFFSNLINKNYRDIYFNKKLNLEKNYKNIIKQII